MADNIENKENQDLGPRKFFPTQLSLTIRVIVGAYVIYSMYEAFTSSDEKSTILYVLIVLLTIIGAVLVVWSLKKLIKGEYAGGKADLWKDLDEEDEVKPQDKLEDTSETDEDSSNLGEDAVTVEDTASKEEELENVNDIAEVIEP